VADARVQKLPSWEVDCLTFESFLELAEVNPRDIIFMKMDIEGAEGKVLPLMRKWLKKNGSPPIHLSLHKWLWPKTGETPGLLAGVFSDYPHVYNSRLEEVPRSKINADLFGEGSDNAYLLANKEYKFAELTLNDFATYGPLPLPQPKKKKALRRRPAEEEEEDEEAADDDGGDAQAQENEEEEAPRRSRRGSSGKSRRGKKRAAAESDDADGEAEEEGSEEPPRRRRRRGGN